MYDGDTVGPRLAQFLKDYKIVNGLRYGEHFPKIANGAGDLAVQLIASLKNEINRGGEACGYTYSHAGHIYLVPAGAPDEEYTYSVVVTEPQDHSSTGSVAIRYGEFEGPPEEFLKELSHHG